VEITVESAYKEPAYKELPVIRNWFYFPELYQGTTCSSLHVYKKLRLKEQFFMVPIRGVPGPILLIRTFLGGTGGMLLREIFVPYNAVNAFWG